jgi:uncharacterized protein
MGISRIFQVLTPKERKFYPMFEQAADNLVKAAILLNKLFLTTDSADREKIIADIKEHEHISDDITHTLYDELNKTFITPFDREDINKLNDSLDDVLNMINSFAQKVKNHPPKNDSPYFLEISELILQASREIKTAIAELRNLKNPRKIMDSCIRINEIENQADEVNNKALADLFENEKDAIELIKIKEMISALEKATDRAEDVSDVLKAIIVKAG